MSGTIAVFRREILIQRLVFPAAVAASAVPFVLAPAIGMTGVLANDARSSIALVVSVAFAFGTALGFGITMLPPGIASRRIAFDFARPLSGLAVWLGRLLAALLLSLASGAIVLLPTILAGARFVPGDFLIDPSLIRGWPLLAFAAVLIVVLVGQAVGLVFRSHSILLAVDVVLGLAMALAVSALLSRLPVFVAPLPRSIVVVGLTIAGAIALLAGGWASVARGRTEIRAAHRAHSAAFWLIAWISVAVAAGYTRWVRGAAPEDLRGFWVTPAASGPWVLLDGEARGARSRFLLDTVSGRSLRAWAVGPTSPAISRDGRVASWFEGGYGEGPHPVVRLALDSARPAPARTRIILESQPWFFVLSPDGSRLATTGDGTISIHDLAGGRTLVSARIPGADSVRGFFVDADRLRIYLQSSPRTSAATLQIAQVDVRSKSLRLGTPRELPRGPLYIVADRAGERAVAIELSDKRVLLLDGLTGEERATLLDGAAETTRWPGFLDDGRIVIGESSGGASRLRVFDPSGAAKAAIPLPGRAVMVGGEISAGRLLVGLGDAASWSTHLVDVNAGTVRKVADDAYPAARLAGFSLVPNASAVAGGDATRLLVQHDSELGRLEGDGGKIQVLLRGLPVR